MCPGAATTINLGKKVREVGQFTDQAATNQSPGSAGVIYLRQNVEMEPALDP